MFICIFKTGGWINIEISEDFLVTEYTNNLKSIQIIHDEFNIPKKVIEKYLKVYNIPILTKYDRIINKYKEKVITDYTYNNKSLTEISKLYRIAPYTVKRILESENINILNSDEMSGLKNNERRKENRRYQIDFDYFKKWTNDMAYILGLIYSDGNVYNNRLKVELKDSDIDLLEDVKTKLGYEGNILKTSTTCNGKRFNTARLSISSIDICEDLYKLGVTENKSLDIKFPNIPQEFIIDFIRGYFDGDGSIEVKKQDNTYQLRTRFCTGSIEFITELMNKLCIYGLNPKNIHKKSNGNCYDLTYSTKESLLLYKLMYHSKDCIFLKRKKDKFEKGIKIRNGNIQ